MLLFSFFAVSMATSVSFLPGITPEDKLRLAASKGQLDKVKEFIVAGASFDPDKVRIVFYWQHILFLL